LRQLFRAIISRGFNLDQLGSAVDSTTYVDVNCDLWALSISTTLETSPPSRKSQGEGGEAEKRRNFSGSSLARWKACRRRRHTRDCAYTAARIIKSRYARKHPNHVGEEWGKLLLGGESTVLQRNERTASYLRRGLPLSRIFSSIYVCMYIYIYIYTR